MNDSGYNGPRQAFYDNLLGLPRRLEEHEEDYGETTLEEVRARLDKTYKSGVPFFTKERIQFAWDQAKREPGYGKKVFTKDINDKLVEYDGLPGEVVSREMEGEEEVHFIA
jgi:hypothetical protein